MSNFILSAFADEIDDDLDKQMDVLDQHSIKYIELRSIYGRNITDYTLDEIRGIKKKLDDRNFKISAIGSPIGKIKITDEFGPHFELFKHTLEIAKILDTQNIRMFSFYIPKDTDPSTYTDEVLLRWSRFTESATKYDMMLLHENEKDIYGDTPERCIHLIKSMNSAHVKAIFDPANFIQCAVKTYPDAFDILKEHIYYMHIKDARSSDNTVVPSGQGDGEIKNILRTLKADGFEGFLSLEPHLGSFSALKSLELDLDDKEMPKSGSELFSLAADSLKQILCELEDS